MRSRIVALFVATLAARALSVAPPPPRDGELARVAAFARLYGVVRYFYPSDAAAALDWSRFTVHGVSRVRAAPDSPALRDALEQLFAPLGPGIEVATRPGAPRKPARAREPLVAWRYLGPGLPENGAAGPYRGQRTHRTVSAIDGFANVMQTVPAEALRGNAIRMRARVRATATDASGAAALWLRVDRPDREMGFFDNMQDRPVREPVWRTYVIEGTVASDALAVAFGAMASGAVTADVDAVELAVKDPAGGWTDVPFPDPGFEAASEDGTRGWFRARASRRAVVTRPAVGATVDVPLGSGLTARVPLTLTDGEARTDPARKRTLDTLTAAVAAVSGPAESPDLDQRLADVVVAWNVLRHFFPCWAETGVAWEMRLLPQLEAASAARTRAAQHAALRTLVAEARDGHGFVADALEKTPQGLLPVQLAVIGGRLVVTASTSPAEVPVGAVVETIDGLPAAERLGAAGRLQSGTDAWRRVQATAELARGPKGASLALRVDTGSGAKAVTLRFAGTQPPPEGRPEAVTQVEPGIWYVDLTRAPGSCRTSSTRQRATAGCTSPGSSDRSAGRPAGRASGGT